MIKILDNFELPKEMTRKVSPELVAQSVRAFLANQRQGNQSALTRAEVNRTRKKIFKQKGTGHARHGDRKSPIFVGGGATFAPKPRDYSQSISQKMRNLAKLGALSMKKEDSTLLVASGLDKMTGKTSEMAEFVAKVRENSPRLTVLVVTDILRDNVVRAGQNMAYVQVITWQMTNAYDLIRANKVVLMEEALGTIEKSDSKSSPVESPKTVKTSSKPVKKVTKTVKTKSKK